MGWIASRDPSIIKACAGARDYMAISVSQVDDQIASFALLPDVIHNLLARNSELARTNLAILGEFVSKFSKTCSWVRPTAGMAAFVKVRKDGRAVDDCSLVRGFRSLCADQLPDSARGCVGSPGALPQPFAAGKEKWLRGLALL